MQVKNYGFLGSDVSKGMCNFVLEKGDGERLESNFQLDDTREGHQKLFELLQEWKKKHNLKKIVVGLESTGGYENNWYKNLRSRSSKLGIEVFRINPKRIYHEAKVEGVRSVDDGVSAQVIASYMRKNYGKKDLEPKRVGKVDKQQDELEGLRVLYRYIKKLTTENTRKKNALEKLLYSSLPEMLSIKSEKYANWFLELLIKYPSRELILSAGIEGLTSINHLSAKKAESILEVIGQSINEQVDKYINIAIVEYAKDIQYTTKKINDLKKQISEGAKEVELIKEDIELLNSIGGLSDYSTIGIILEVGILDRFESAGNLVAFFGINPTFKMSGDKNYKVGMSKDGSPHARAILFTAAENVVKNESYFKAIYEKYRVKGQGHRQAIGVIMSKLTRVIYGMLKTRSFFDPGVDIYNQTKKPEVVKKKKSINNNNERRHQKTDVEAPISSRQKKKRKQEQMS